MKELLSSSLRKVLTLLMLCCQGEFSFAQESVPELEVKSAPTQQAVSTEVQLKTEEVEVAVGLDKVLELGFDFSAQLSLSDSALLRVEPDIKKRKITLIGLKPGSTSLTVRDTVGDEKLRYYINVTTNDLSKIVSELRELIGDVEGIEIGIRGGRVFVGGEIVVPNDIKRVAIVLNSFEASKILKMIEMSPQTQVLIASEMHEELQKNNFKNVTVRVVNRAFWVEGTVSSQDEAVLVQSIVSAYLPEKIEAVHNENDIEKVQPPDRKALYSFLTIDDKQKQEEKKEPLPKLIKVNTQFVELRKDYNKVFGFKWAPLMSRDGSKISIGPTDTGGTSTKSDGLFTAVISDLFPRLNSMKNAGYGRVVHSGMVMVRENEVASLVRSTSVPTIVGENSNFSRPAALDFGLNMTVTKPQILEEDNVDLPVSVKVSLQTASSNGVPIPTSNEISTRIMVKSAETAVLGGVMQSHDLANYDRDDPAPNSATVSQNSTEAPPQQLFGILRSRNQSIARNQYVIFITPEIVTSASEATENIKNKFKRRGR